MIRAGSNWRACVASAAVLFYSGGAVRAEQPASCTAQDFAAAVDKSGAALRAFTLEAQPKLQAKMRRYGDIQKLDADAYEDRALDAIHDARLQTLNEKSASLLLEIDTRGRVEEGKAPDCAKLKDIAKLSSELMAVMREKSDYMLAQLDAKIAAAGGGEEKAPAASIKSAAQSKTEKTVAAKPAEQKTAVARKDQTSAKPQASWPATTKPNDAYTPTPPPVIAEAPGQFPGPAEGGDGYTIEEIRDATKGFFGTISTNLATVIEHAFKTWGRPTAYVLGTEGGGAFFAGLRFGEGTLFLRHHAFSQKIFWHGPSLGTDLGAAGSRTMFLIYNLREPNQILRTFTGVDGSAYLVGGVGLTLLKGGEVIMAPIRSGIGLRFGANIGYLRFSDHATWNPF